MYLDRGGREFIKWTFTGLPGDHGAVEVKLGDEWHALDVTGNVGSILLAGPDADPTGAVVVTTDTDVKVRVTDSPEIVVRGGGWIRLTA
ncbi:hypothetical protein IT072_02290 [Leifsonia sp. ZF2019]|uniref:hypothetical protein n=1 Tax=Leifsonia sp. ZF2019 TaxID=2781978 RepID=UPI001CBB38C3|nr:hypothetical protein [Leifsonia sp. ZF2019]UAJ78296.1 hypothetical protein IT072_13615 [Leifsonia sp. ZF2019]UAJ79926.1 hypothetical protein IT072_02290 [Leifsonia sp. ZF2019]